jgi:phage-related protein
MADEFLTLITGGGGAIGGALGIYLTYFKGKFEALEDKFQKHVDIDEKRNDNLDKKLDTLFQSVNRIEVSVAEIKGHTDGQKALANAIADRIDETMTTKTRRINRTD